MLLKWSSMAVDIIYLSFVLTSGIISVATTRGEDDELKRYSRSGNIKIGGLFPLHFYDEANQQCGGLRELGALKKIEAMVYVIDNVNADATLLPNITLGFDIYDSCSYDAVALQASLQMVPLVESTFMCNVSMESPIVGMVGAQRSSSSMQAALVLGHHHIPQISFLSTSDELSNIHRYPYFFRSVAPDRFQVRVMVDVLRHFGWKYVSFLNSDDSFGKSAQRAFRQQADDLEICLGIVRTISLYADDNTFDQVVQDLLYKSTTRTTVVLLFAQLETVYGVLSAAMRAKAYRSFIWIGGDGWGNYNDVDDIREYLQATIGALTVAPLSQSLLDYDVHFNSEVQYHHDNPWLQEFWAKYGNCSTSKNIFSDPRTNRSVGWCNPPTESVHESLVMDSTLAFVYALDKMYRDKCKNAATDGVCDDLRDSLRSDEVLDYLFDVDFTSPANGRIRFNEVGDGGGKYAVFNLQWREDNNRYEFTRVGMWDGGLAEGETLTLDSPIPWYLKDSSVFDSKTGFPKSICSEPCASGEKMSFSSENPCCWTCVRCHRNERLSVNRTSCESCIDADNNVFAWPSKDFTSCVDIEPDVNLKDTPWASVMIVISALGVIFTLILIVFYVINRETRLIKASSRELGCLIFIAIMLLYVTSMLYILPPHPVTCALVRLGPPVATSLLYISVAVKTIRLYRIFMAGKKSVKRPKFISPTFQVSITLGLCLVPITWMTVWLILVPPQVILDMPDHQIQRVQRTCAQKLIEKIGTMIWDLILIIVCCIYAFRTRKLPNNYKESRFITFCVFSTLLVLLAFSPTIFTTREPFYRSVYSALGLIVIATVSNLCLFVIKFYALYFVSEKDLVVTTSNEKRNSLERNGVANVSSNVSTSSHKELRALPNHSEANLNQIDTNPDCCKSANLELTLSRTTGATVQVSFTTLNTHKPTLPTVPIDDKQGHVSEGDVNLGFHHEDGDEGAYNLDDHAGGVYCGPTETVT